MVVCVYFIIIAKYVLKRLSSVYISTLCIEYIHIHKVGKYIYIYDKCILNGIEHSKA